MAVEAIRVLSVRQPYADQIIFGDKWNELRSWKTPYRGTVYIHASRWDGPKSQGSPGEGTTGAIIGRVQLVDCIFNEDLCDVESHLHYKGRLHDWLKPLASYLKQFPKESWQEGADKWNWIVVEPAPLVLPVRVLGKLNLWNTEYPSEQLKVSQTSTKTLGPLVKDYPCFVPPSVIYKRVLNPGGTFSGPLYKFLKKEKANGAKMTTSVLAGFTKDVYTSVGNLLNTLKNNDEFERVPEKPEQEEWWRVRQTPIEINLEARYKKYDE